MKVSAVTTYHRTPPLKRSCKQKNRKGRALLHPTRAGDCYGATHFKRRGYVSPQILVVTFEEAIDVDRFGISAHRNWSFGSFKSQQEVSRYGSLSPARIIAQKRPEASKYTFEVLAQTVFAAANRRDTLRDFLPAERTHISIHEPP